MGEILSHAEVETLLSAIEPAPLCPASASAGESPLGKSSTWEPHDLHRPEPLHGDLLKILQALQAGLCQRLRVRLSSLLRATVKVCPVGLSNTTVNEFTSGLEPSCLVCRATSAELSGSWLLTWESNVAYSLIYTLLGGEGSPRSNSASQSPTEIELRLLSRLSDAVLEELQSVAGDSEHRRVATIHSNRAEAVSSVANVSVLCLSFEITCSGERGLMHFCMSRPQADVRSFQYAPDHSVRNEIQPIGRFDHETRRIGVELSADLARLRLRASEVAGLVIGDVLMTDIIPKADITLRLADQPLFQAAIGTLMGKKAVRVTNPLLPENSD